MSGRQLFQEGLALFNQGEFFQCHEVLEELWREQKDPERQVTQAIIQVAVGTYHLQRDNYGGAVKLFQRALERLRNNAYQGCPIDIPDLIAQTEELLAAANDKREFRLPSISPPV